MKDKEKPEAPITFLIIGTLIVADITGACIMSLFNETVSDKLKKITLYGIKHVCFE